MPITIESSQHKVFLYVIIIQSALVIFYFSFDYLTKSIWNKKRYVLNEVEKKLLSIFFLLVFQSFDALATLRCIRQEWIEREPENNGVIGKQKRTATRVSKIPNAVFIAQVTKHKCTLHHVWVDQSGMCALGQRQCVACSVALACHDMSFNRPIYSVISSKHSFWCTFSVFISFIFFRYFDRRR